MTKPFEAYFDENSRSLIFCEENDDDSFFCDSENNIFWNLIASAISRYNSRKVPSTESQKIEICQKYHLALAKIKDSKNHFELVKSFQEKKLPVYIYCTSENAKALYEKWYKGDLKQDAKILPSTIVKGNLSRTEMKNLVDAFEKVLMQLVDRKFDEVADENSKILILGTMPSEISIKEEFYYGNKGNRFWPALANAFGCKKEDLSTKQDKIAFCKKNNIALWDVIRSCTMIAGADKSIQRDASLKCNDIEKLLQKSNIKKIFCTGKTSYAIYQECCESKTKMKAIPLHSPSGSAKNEKTGGLSDIHLFEEYKKALTNI